MLLGAKERYEFGEMLVLLLIVEGWEERR